MAAAPLAIRTERLVLRQLMASDADAFAALNADEEVMEFFPRTWTREESDEALERVRKAFESRGFGVYAVEVDGEFAGVAGLSVPAFPASFTPCIEILWRLARRFWGRGYATEAAGAVLAMAFEELRLPEVVAFCVAGNVRSMRVMEKIGMVRDFAGDFAHPAVDDLRLIGHVLYRARAVLR